MLRIEDRFYLTAREVRQLAALCGVPEIVVRRRQSRDELLELIDYGWTREENDTVKHLLRVEYLPEWRERLEKCG